MARQSLTLPVQSNSQPVHQEQYKSIVLRNEQTLSDWMADGCPRSDDEFPTERHNNGFANMMQSNRGVL